MVNLKTEVCAISLHPEVPKVWVKEVEIAKVSGRSYDVEVN